VSPAILTKTPHHSVRTTIRTIVVIVASLIVAMWALVGSSLVTARQAALRDARLASRNLMIAFREEIALILRGLDGEIKMISERVRREGDAFDLYAGARRKFCSLPGWPMPLLSARMDRSNR
jgi:hypothetical protein